MPNQLLPYADENHDPADAPPEVVPTASGDRFPLTRPKADVTSITQNGKKFAERVVDAANTGRAEADQITVDEVPEGLIRAFEAIDADPKTNLSKLSSGAISTISTGDGELLVVEVLVNPLAVLPDPMNGRTAEHHVNRRRRNVVPTDYNAAIDLPIYDMESAQELIDVANESHSELGFRNPRIKPGKDRSDLLSIGMQGTHDSILLMPQVFRDPEGNTMHSLVARDGNRRLAMSLRVQQDVAGYDQSQLTSWTAPMWDGTSYVLKDWDADAVNLVRERAAVDAQSAGKWFAKSTSAEDVEAFMTQRVAPHIMVRSFLRTRALKAFIVVGVNNESLSDTARNAVAPSAAVMDDKVRSLHIGERAAKPWADNAQSTMVANSVLSGIRDGISRGKDIVPLSSSEIEAVLNNTTKPWATADDLATHPLRLAAKVAATIICNNHDGSASVRNVMKQFGYSTAAAKIGDHKARIAADRVVPLLGFSDPDASATKRVRTVIERISRNRYFQDVSDEVGVWWELLDLDADELAKRAADEIASQDEGHPHEAGQACRALAFKALLCLSASPAVQSANSRASEFAITINGLDERGITKTTPDQVIFRLFEHEQGVEQLAEVVRCGETIGGPALPKNVIDPEAVVESDPTTKGYLTEEFLRGPALGWETPTLDDNEDEQDSEDEARPEISPYQEYLAWQTRFVSLLEQASAEAEAVADTGELAVQFQDHGIADASELLQKAQRLVELITIGKTLAGTRG